MANGTINKVILIGRLGADPEIRYTQGNVAVVSFNLATNEAWRNSNGEIETRTDWHRIVAWRNLAEFANQYLQKGKLIYVEGKLRTRKYDDPKNPGNIRYTTEVIADSIQLLGSKGNNTSEFTPPKPEPQESNSPTVKEDFMDKSPLGEEELDDLPF